MKNKQPNSSLWGAEEGTWIVRGTLIATAIAAIATACTFLIMHKDFKARTRPYVGIELHSEKNHVSLTNYGPVPALNVKWSVWKNQSNAWEKLNTFTVIIMPSQCHDMDFVYFPLLEKLRIDPASESPKNLFTVDTTTAPIDEFRFECFYEGADHEQYYTKRTYSVNLITKGDKVAPIYTSQEQSAS